MTEIQYIDFVSRNLTKKSTAVFNIVGHILAKALRQSNRFQKTLWIFHEVLVWMCDSSSNDNVNRLHFYWTVINISVDVWSIINSYKHYLELTVTVIIQMTIFPTTMTMVKWLLSWWDHNIGGQQTISQMSSSITANEQISTDTHVSRVYLYSVGHVTLASGCHVHILIIFMVMGNMIQQDGILFEQIEVYLEFNI